MGCNWSAINGLFLSYLSQQFNFSCLPFSDQIVLVPIHLRENEFFGHILTIEFPPSTLLVVLSITAFIVHTKSSTTPNTTETTTITMTTATTTATIRTTSNTTTTTATAITNATTSTTRTTNTTSSRPSGTEPTNQTGHVAYQGSLRVTSDDFIDTLLDQDSQDYKEREIKYQDMVSYTPYRILCQIGTELHD